MQVFDFRYRAPHRDKSEKITENGTVTVWFNGKKVQDAAPFGEPRSAFHSFRFGTMPYLEKIRDRQKPTMTGPAGTNPYSRRSFLAFIASLQRLSLGITANMLRRSDWRLNSLSGSLPCGRINRRQQECGVLIREGVVRARE